MAIFSVLTALTATSAAVRKFVLHVGLSVESSREISLLARWMLGLIEISTVLGLKDTGLM